MAAWTQSNLLVAKGWRYCIQKNKESIVLTWCSEFVSHDMIMRIFVAADIGFI